MRGAYTRGARPRGTYRLVPQTAGAPSASIASIEDNDLAAFAAGSVIEASIAATEADDLAAFAAGPVAAGTTADIATTEANDTMAALAGAINQANVAATEEADTAAISAGPPVEEPQFFGGAAWVWPKSRRDRRYLDDAPEVLPAVEIPTPRAKIVPAPAVKFDVAGAIAAAKKAARSVAAEEVALRRVERKRAAEDAARGAALQAKAKARAKAIADEEDDLEALLMGAW